MKASVALAAAPVIVVLMLAGCSKPPVPAPTPQAAQAPAAESAPAVIELDEQARAQARLVVAAVTVQSIPETVRAAGRLTTNENATWRVGAITEGRIIRVDVKIGDRVRKDQILARMHSHDIHEARAQYRRSLAEVTRLKSNVEFARRTRDRMRRLQEMKAASVEQVDQAENEFKNSQVALSNAEIEMNRTRLHLVEFLGVSLEGPEEHGHSANPEDHVEDLIPIRSPADGVVLTREVTPGVVVTASSDLFTISDLSTVWVIAAVQEESLSRLRVGMPAHVHVQAYPDRQFQGRVIRIDEKLDPETRTVSVRVAIDNRAGLLKPEMYSSVDLDVGGTAPALFVPQVAVQDVKGQALVFLENKPGSYTPRPVQTGRILDGLIQVTGGLKGGERVVSEGSFILKSQLLKASLEGE